MARQYGWAVCVVGLHVCVLTGCLGPSAHPDPEPVAPVPTPTAPSARSPYQPQLDEIHFDDRQATLAPEKTDNELEVKCALQSDVEKPSATDQPVIAWPPAPFSSLEPTPSEPDSTHSAAASPENPLLAALRCVLANKPAEAFDLLHAYDKPTQEILLALLPLAARLGEGGLERASPQEVAALIDQLNTLSTLLRGRTALMLEKPCFCHKIKGFGLYDPLPSNPAFPAAADGQHGERAQVYAEVRNFLSRTDGKVYEIFVTGRLEIYGSDGRRWWVRGFRDDPARSLSARRDFFVSFDFYLPQGLPPGNYVLGVEVRDETLPTPESKPRVAQCKLPFRIAGPGEK
jgi:hypothetical protein